MLGQDATKHKGLRIQHSPSRCNSVRTTDIDYLFSYARAHKRARAPRKLYNGRGGQGESALVDEGPPWSHGT